MTHDAAKEAIRHVICSQIGCDGCKDEEPTEQDDCSLLASDVLAKLAEMGWTPPRPWTEAEIARGSRMEGGTLVYRTYADYIDD